MRENKLFLSVAIGLGIISYSIFLAYHNIADGDLWSRLIQGGSIWIEGKLITKDVFSFTPTFPEYIDHEWGSGLIFYSLLKIFGPGALLFFKILTGLGALVCAISVGRFLGTSWPVLLLLALPVGWAVFPGYVPVVRCYAITYLFFSITLFCLELIRGGRKWGSGIIIFVMMIWANVHAGFAVGLAVIGIYTFEAFLSRRMPRLMFGTALAALLITLVNPYGIELWGYLLRVVTHIPKGISEWQPMPLTGCGDSFLGFRVLFIIAFFSVIFGRSGLGGSRKYLPCLLILLLTAYMTFRSRRHVPFFALSCGAFLGPYLEESIKRAVSLIRSPLKEKIGSMSIILVIYGIVAFLAISQILPRVSFQVLAPVGFYPVREADILMHAKSKGNLVVPLRWGNYAMWRLYPNIKVSISGRYDTIYPESTRDMEYDFFFKSGPNWDRILKTYEVDYIMLDRKNTNINEEDIEKEGFEIIWRSEYSALFAKKNIAPFLKDIARNLPHETIEPLDAGIPEQWRVFGRSGNDW